MIYICNDIKLKCNNVFNCDDGSDEHPSACDNCNRPGLARCRDDSLCVKTEWLCDGNVECVDGSDESDTWSNCSFCTEKGSVPCPGFPDICAKVCDGAATCPDKWDELLSTCKEHKASCSTDTRLFECNDGSSCVERARLCNHVKDCADGEDERAEHCKQKCRSSDLPCDNSSCIKRQLACSAHQQPLCEDGSDMAADLCNGKCYTSFPYVEDPYRVPCENGTKKCILRTSKCDGNPDCKKGTGLAKSWDEQDCPFFTQIRLIILILVCLAATVLCWPLFFLLARCSQSIEQKKCTQLDFVAKANVDKSSPSPSSSPPCIPSFLLHPKLSNMSTSMSSQQGWSWQEVGEQLRIEVFFFNRDPQVLCNFLTHVEAQDAHPDIVFEAFKGFFHYLGSKGYDRMAVAFNMRQTIGQHRLAHMALKGPPNIINKKMYELQKRADVAEMKGGIYSHFVSFLRAVVASVYPFLLVFDYAKDIVLYLIVDNALERLDAGCKDTHFDCLAASGVERDLVTALLITFCLSLILNSLNSYHMRKRFFKTNRCLDLLFFFVSPLLPAVYHISQARMELETKKSTLTNKEFQQRKETEAKNFHSIQQTKLMEVSLEAIMQIVLLSGLATFYWFVYTGPSGQSYAYFWGVALLVLKGNTALFFANLLFSLVGPCIFFTNYTNTLLRGCLNVTRKVVLLAQNLLFLLVRVLTITSAIFIRVMNHWFVGNLGQYATSKLDTPQFAFEFQKYFSKGLDAITIGIRTNTMIFIGFLLIHLMLVASHALLCSAKFGRSMMRERLMHLVSSFWLPLPFLTRREVDRDDQKAELWFLVILHTLENICMLLISTLIHLGNS